MRRAVIVGAGQAGRRTAECLRELDEQAEILLIGEEPGRDAVPLRRLIGSGRPVDLARLRDPDVQLRHLLWRSRKRGGGKP